MALLASLGIKQKDGSYKNYTINDEADKFGNNVSMYVQQTKEEREAKAPKQFLGSGKVFWTDGKSPVIPAKVEKQPAKATADDSLDLPF